MGEVDELGMSLPCKQEDLSSTPRTENAEYDGMRFAISLPDRWILGSLWLAE